MHIRAVVSLMPGASISTLINSLLPLKRIIYQLILSVISLVGSFYIVGYSINIFGMNSDLYMGLIILALGNILTLININKPKFITIP